MTTIAENLARVHGRIARACEACGRDPSAVRLLAVSKFHPASALREAYAAGQRDFGENYAQELGDKARELADLADLRFRFIGALQRNKARLLIEARCAVETLSSEAHAQALHDRARSSAVRLEVMIQVNVAGEAQKSGIAPAALSPLVQRVRSLGALSLSGLMTIPPAGDPRLAAECYAQLAQLAREHALTQLSMGMSDDLELAVAAGATSVRVGTAIFGPRG